MSTLERLYEIEVGFDKVSEELFEPSREFEVPPTNWNGFGLDSDSEGKCFDMKNSGWMAYMENLIKDNPEDYFQQAKKEVTAINGFIPDSCNFGKYLFAILRREMKGTDKLKIDDRRTVLFELAKKYFGNIAKDLHSILKENTLKKGTAGYFLYRRLARVTAETFLNQLRINGADSAKLEAVLVRKDCFKLIEKGATLLYELKIINRSPVVAHNVKIYIVVPKAIDFGGWGDKVKLPEETKPNPDSSTKYGLFKIPIISGEPVEFQFGLSIPLNFQCSGISQPLKFIVSIVESPTTDYSAFEKTLTETIFCGASQIPGRKR